MLICAVFVESGVPTSSERYAVRLLLTLSMLILISGQVSCNLS